MFHKAREERVLSMFVEVVNESGTTFEQSLLGTKGIDTIDPENIEAILSSDFSSESSFETWLLRTVADIDPVQIIPSASDQHTSSRFSAQASSPRTERPGNTRASCCVLNSPRIATRTSSKSSAACRTS